jgi:CO/xanthine dehydrogenase Mo-binding subunit
VNALDPARRHLLSAGALVVAFSLAPRAFGQGGEGAVPRTQSAKLPGSLRTTPILDSWIRVAADGAITVFTGKAELGQGIRTALIQLAAEELDVDPAAIRLITADTGQTPNEGVTAGSHSMQDSGVAIMNAAANVRVMLLEAAAASWRTPPDKLTTTGDGRVKGPGKTALGYGELAAKLSLHVEARPDAPRRGGKRRTVGHTLGRVDIPGKMTGGQAFVQDLRLPGMLHARVVRGPSCGTRLKAGDIDAVLAMPGVVRVVRNGAFTAVIADKQWQAIQAMLALQRSGWERTEPPIPADLHAAVQAAPTEDEIILDIHPPVPAAVKTVKARYTRPWLIHGSIGPSCAVAQFKDGMLTVWSHTQGVFPLRQSIAPLVRLPLDKVRVIHVEGSGCYGHNGADDVAGDAAMAAMAMPGVPVRMQWMREQEHGWEPMGPGMIVEAEAGLDANNRITAWRYGVWSNTHNGRPTTAGGLLAGLEVDPPFKPQIPRPIPMPEGGGDRNGIPLYRVGDAVVVSHFIAKAPVRVSALRSLGGYFNVVAIESLMDELALAGGLDPVALRLSHLDDPRAAEVVRRTAERFGWDKRPKGDGVTGCGFGFARYKNLAAYCAVAMQVRIDRDSGRVIVERVIATVDSGEAVNPGGIKNQIEGAVIQAISWTGSEEMRFNAQRRTAQDWIGYPIPRFQEIAGSVEVSVVDRPGQPFLGSGEAAQGPAGGALTNAVADALGARIRDLPLSTDKIKAALKA